MLLKKKKQRHHILKKTTDYPFESRHENPHKILVNHIKQNINRIIPHGQEDLYQKYKTYFNIWKPINVICHTNKVKKKKTYMNISLDAQKNFWENVTPYHD